MHWTQCQHVRTYICAYMSIGALHSHLQSKNQDSDLGGVMNGVFEYIAGGCKGGGCQIVLLSDRLLGGRADTRGVSDADEGSSNDDGSANRHSSGKDREKRSSGNHSTSGAHFHRPHYPHHKQPTHDTQHNQHNAHNHHTHHTHRDPHANGRHRRLLPADIRRACLKHRVKFHVINYGYGDVAVYEDKFPNNSNNPPHRRVHSHHHQHTRGGGGDELTSPSRPRTSAETHTQASTITHTQNPRQAQIQAQTPAQAQTRKRVRVQSILSIQQQRRIVQQWFGCFQYVSLQRPLLHLSFATGTHVSSPSDRLKTAMRRLIEMQYAVHDDGHLVLGHLRTPSKYVYVYLCVSVYVIIVRMDVWKYG